MRFELSLSDYFLPGCGAFIVMIVLALHLNACRSTQPILRNKVSIQNLGTKEWLWLAGRVLEVSGFAVTLKRIFINTLRKPVVISGQFEIVCMLVNKGCITWHLLKTHSAAGEQLYIELKDVKETKRCYELPGDCIFCAAGISAVAWQCKTNLNRCKIKHL